MYIYVRVSVCISRLRCLLSLPLCHSTRSPPLAVFPAFPSCRPIRYHLPCPGMYLCLLRHLLQGLRRHAVSGHPQEGCRRVCHQPLSCREGAVMPILICSMLPFSKSSNTVNRYTLYLLICQDNTTGETSCKLVPLAAEGEQGMRALTLMDRPEQPTDARVNRKKRNR